MFVQEAVRESAHSLPNLFCSSAAIFAAGHTFGFRQNNPRWGADAVLGLMRSVRFDAQGFTRTYWDFFSAFGLFFSVFLLFAAVLAWLLGGLPAETLAPVRSIAWALAICFVAVTALSWRYAFTTPSFSRP
jgi:hypothetical protein